MKRKTIFVLLVLLVILLSYVSYKYYETTKKAHRFHKAMEVIKYGNTHNGKVVLDNLIPLAKSGDDISKYWLGYVLSCGEKYNLTKDTAQAIDWLKSCEQSYCVDLIKQIKQSKISGEYNWCR